MIMGEHDPGAAVLRGVGDDIAEREAGAGCVALVAGHMKALRPVVDMGHPQAFPRRIRFSQTTRKEGLGRCKPIELQRVFGTLIPHARRLR